MTTKIDALAGLLNWNRHRHRHVLNAEARAIANSVISGQTPPIPPMNTALPTISGTNQVGQTLTATTGTWTGSPSFAYQWSRMGVPIGGAVASTYVPVAADIGKTLSVTVTGANGGGSVSATSAATSAVVDIIPTNTAVPTISNTMPQVGQVLTATTGTWANNPTSYAYQWKSAGVAATGAGAATANYMCAMADMGNTLTVSVTATNSGGASTPATSAATSQVVVAATIPVNTLAPAITGTAQVGQILSVDTGTWTQSPNAYAYQWQREGVDIAGATTSARTCAAADLGALMTCKVTASNSAGASAPAISNLVGPVISTTAIYVSSSTGNDANAGTINAPWQTLAKVNGASLAAGTSVLFKRGDTWRDGSNGTQSGLKTARLNCQGGASGNPIVYDAYGTGANPTFLGSVAASTTGDWTNIGGNIWTSNSIFSPIGAGGGMATLVQSKSYTGAAIPTHTITLNSSPVQNNILILCVVSASTVPTPSGWTVVNSAVDFTGTYMYFKTAGSSESSSISVIPSVSAPTCLAVLEYNGLTASPLDQTASATGQVNPVGTGTTPITTQANEVLIALVGIDESFSSNITAWSNSFVQQFNVSTGAGNPNVRMGLALRTVSSTGAYSSAATISPDIFNCSGIIGTFKIASAGLNGQPVQNANDVGSVTWGTYPNRSAAGMLPLASPQNDAQLVAQGDWRFSTTDWKVHIFSVGNPATAMSPSLELGVDADVLNINFVNNVTVQNITVFNGAANGVVYGGGTTGITVRDCVFGWIGGGNLFGGGTRYGNGTVCSGGATNCLLERCWVFECYDGGITQEDFSNTNITFNNLTYRNNVVYNCPVLIELNLGALSGDVMSNIFCHNNTCPNPAGNGHAKEGDNHHICLNPSGVVPTIAFEIINNSFTFGVIGLNMGGGYPTYPPGTPPSACWGNGLMVMDYNNWVSSNPVHSGNPFQDTATITQWAALYSPAQETHGLLQVAPQYVNSALGNSDPVNLAPAAGSPLLGAGKNLFAQGVVWDFNKRPRPSSGPFTIGAFQDSYNPLTLSLNLTGGSIPGAA